MINFTPDGQCEVHFDIVGGDWHGRRELRFTLDEFLALAKTTETEEQLRFAMFSFVTQQEKDSKKKSKVVRIGG